LGDSNWAMAIGQMAIGQMAIGQMAVTKAGNRGSTRTWSAQLWTQAGRLRSTCLIDIRVHVDFSSAKAQRLEAFDTAMNGRFFTAHS